MSDAQSPSRRIPTPRLHLTPYLRACERKGARNRAERAELLGLNRQSVYRYETGAVEPLISTAVHIARQLDRTVEELWAA